jgi:hypothetical protein
MPIRITCGLLIASMLSIAPVHADEDKARLGRTMWTAFACATFAELSERKEEQDRLFQTGLKAGREFIEALQNGKISNEEVDSKVPVGVIWLLAGPSIDFIIGRVYSGAEEDAYDSIVKKDASGLPLDIKDWITDKQVQKPKAEAAYLKGNCELIK